jgi:hypothetical protein
MMRTTKRIASAITVMAATAAVMVGTTATAAQAATVHGCRAGWVCLYPEDAGWNGDSPSYEWYEYGTYALSNQFGNHVIFSNQTGDAVVSPCLDYGGTNCLDFVLAGDSITIDFTPINSVVLEQ